MPDSPDRPIITMDDVAGLTPEEAVLVVATSSISQAFAHVGHQANVTMPAYIVDWLVLRTTASMNKSIDEPSQTGLGLLYHRDDPEGAN